MNLQLSSFINRLKTTSTTMTPAMKMNKATAITFKESKNTQNGFINSEMLNNNKFVTNLKLTSWHVNGAAGVAV